MRERNKAVMITGAKLLALSLISVLVGGWVAGWDFAAYFQSAAFVWVCVLLGAYAVIVGIVFLNDWVKRA